VDRSSLAAAFGRRPVVFLDTCDSTNRVAREAARAWPGPPTPGPLVVADHQTAGRGRRGRTWEAKPGENLLFSLVLAPRVPPDRAARCVMVWAAALAEALDVQVKWPNDLVAREVPGGPWKKLAGILAELEVDQRGPPRVRHVVLGVGVNVDQVAFPGLPDATSLARLRRGPVGEHAALLRRLVDAVERVDVTRGDALDPWRARSATLGQRVRVAEVEGVAEDLRDDGALLVDGHPVLAGDVHLLDG
jgi:BirA family biotin operon repressor/biotin-[acetyl-CoA-carboxylase] ligase